MRRKTTNKKVLQAITIGLSAMIAVSSMPMNVMAAEGDNPSETPAPVVEPSTGATSVADNAQIEASEAADAIDKAVTDSNEAAQAVTDASKDDAPADIKIESGDTKQDPTGTGTSTDTLVDEAKDETISNPSGVITGTDGINDDLAKVEVYDEAANNEINKAETAADGLQTDTGNLETSTGQALTDAQDELDNITNATTIPEANAASAELQRIANDTAAEFDAALTIYEADLKAYNDKVAYIEQLEAGYNAELGGAKDGITDLNAKLVAAKKEAEELKIAADNARKNLNQNAQNMLEISRVIDYNNTDTKTTENKDGTTKVEAARDFDGPDGARVLFKKVMLDYYLPVVGIDGKPVPAEQLEGMTWENIGTVKGPDYGLTDNETFHYIELEDEDGNKVIHYFNYKLLSGKYGTEIVIFEKREEETNALRQAKAKKEKEEIIGNPIEEIGETEFDVYKGTDAAKNEVKLTNEKFDEELASGTIKKLVVDGKERYIRFNTDDSESDITEYVVGSDIDGDETDNSQTRVTEISDEENVSYSYNDKGELVKTVTKGVTTVVYTQQTSKVEIDSTVKYTTEEDAKAALQTKLEADLAGKTVDTIEMGDDYAAEETWKATGSYKPVFASSIKIEGKLRDTLYDRIRSEASVRTWMEGESQSILEAELGKAGQTLVGTPEYQPYERIEKYMERELWYTLWGKDVYHYVEKERIVYDTTKATEHKTEWIDGNIGHFWTAERTADYKYTDSNSESIVKTGYSSEEAASAAVNTEYDNYKNVYGSAVDIQKGNIATELTNVKYSMTFSYWEMLADSKKTEQTVVEKITYADTSALTGSVVQNKLYYDYVAEGKDENNSIMTFFDKKQNYRDAVTNEKYTVTAKDRGFNDAIQDAKDLKAKYEALYSKANAAYEEYGNAIKEVKDLSDEINKIPGRNTELFMLNLDELSGMELPALIELLQRVLQENGYAFVDGEYLLTDDKNPEANEEELINSIINLLNAANNMTDIQGLLEEAEGALTDTIARLTPPAPAPAAPGGGEPGGGGDAPAAPAAPAPAAPAAPAAPLAPVADDAAVLGVNRTTGRTIRATDTNANLLAELDDADGAEDLTDGEKQEIVDGLKEEVEVDEKETVNIENEETAKAAGLDEQKVGWWWWLLILLFGAAAIMAYKKYQDNKKKAAETTGTDNK